MKVLIFTVKAGEGHNTTAYALEAALKKQGAESKTVDAGYYVSRLLGTALSYGYLLSIDCCSHAYSKVYGMLEKREQRPHPRSVALSYGFMAARLLECINEYQPDVIVCTHIFAALPVELLRSEGKITAKTIGVITDFTVHPYWEEIIGFDYLVLPSDALIWQGIRKGYDKKQLLPFGIPIKESFSVKIDKKKARRMLGLHPDKQTVMVMGGSMGYGGLSENVAKIDCIDEDFQLIVVCGSNKRELKKIKSAAPKHKILAVGYTKHVPLMMDASDCIVSKPGGLSVSEALSKGLPLVLTHPIPGHEERNSAFLMNSGAAMGISPASPVEEVVWQYLKDRNLQKRMKKSAERMGHADAADKLAEFILKAE